MADEKTALLEGAPRLTTGCIQQRYVLSVMGFLAIANAYTMRTSLSVAITEMACSDPSAGSSTGNSSSNDSQPDVGLQCPADDEFEASSCGLAEFDWDEETQGLILSSFFWGYIVTHLPGGMLAERFGGKYSLGLGILCTAIFTLLSPVAARYGGSGWFIAIRVLMGLGEGTTFPALNALLAQWVPVSERGTLGSLVFAGSLIGNIVANAVSGVVIEATQSWDSVFYLFGGIGVLWFILWQLLCYSDPNSHPFISDEEKKYLNETIGNVDRKEDLPPIPWFHMMKSIPLWGLIFAQIGHDWGFYTMITDLPKYMKNVLRFSISANGLLSALPYVAMWLSSVASGWLADWILVRGYMNTTNVRKVFTIVAAVGPAAGIIGASYANCDRVTVVALFTVGMALMGTFYPGMKVNALDLSPNYAGTLMAFVNGAGSITGMVAPYLIGVVAYNSTLEEWRIVFWITFGILVVTGIIFFFTASGEVQYWNNLYTTKDEETGTHNKDKDATDPYEMTTKPPAYSP
ncbi:putative inorganic phosphate cotransporter isoform X1 [Schistocerca piceifrons]|uniref:putative inorganic phosphate cotransporter isoform X1 n=1 Tax=Schistocerca piceifrons TaxID=274613 RepID=UPI001F5E60AF|nr:putative inorganic phosphate cotransporter isoform X1 [Schistocerca piceifrons]